MPHRQTDTISLSAKEAIAFLLNQGMSREALLHALEEVAPEKAKLLVSESARKWREENGVIRFSVTSDGTSGSDWITRLESKGFRVSDLAKSLLRSSDFQPTSGITTEIAVFPGTLSGDDDCVSKKIRAEAKKRGFAKPNAEVACLIREMFSDKDLEAMGLCWIVVMHEPIKTFGGDPSLLYADRHGGGRWLGARWDDPGDGWDRGDGFALVVSQVSP